MQRVRDAAGQAWIVLEQLFHVLGVAHEYDHQLAQVVLHLCEDEVEHLAARTTHVRRDELVGLVDEENAAIPNDRYFIQHLFGTVHSCGSQLAPRCLLDVVGL